MFIFWQKMFYFHLWIKQIDLKRLFTTKWEFCFKSETGSIYFLLWVTEKLKGRSNGIFKKIENQSLKILNSKSPGQILAEQGIPVEAGTLVVVGDSPVEVDNQAVEGSLAGMDRRLPEHRMEGSSSWTPTILPNWKYKLNARNTKSTNNAVQYNCTIYMAPHFVKV